MCFQVKGSTKRTATAAVRESFKYSDGNFQMWEYFTNIGADHFHKVLTKIKYHHLSTNTIQTAREQFLLWESCLWSRCQYKMKMEEINLTVIYKGYG